MQLTKNNIVPLGKRYIVEAYKQAETTDQGLEVSTGEGYATSVCGTVIRAGEGCRFKEGDQLMWRRYSLDSMKVYTEEGEVEVFALEESEIIAQIVDGVVEPPKDEYAQIKEKIKLNQDASKKNEDSGEESNEEVSKASEEIK